MCAVLALGTDRPVGYGPTSSALGTSPSGAVYGKLHQGSLAVTMDQQKPLVAQGLKAPLQRGVVGAGEADGIGDGWYVGGRGLDSGSGPTGPAVQRTGARTQPTPAIAGSGVAGLSARRFARTSSPACACGWWPGNCADKILAFRVVSPIVGLGAALDGGESLVNLRAHLLPRDLVQVVVLVLGEDDSHGAAPAFDRHGLLCVIQPR